MNLRLTNIPFTSSATHLNDLPAGKLLINTINAHSYNTARNDVAFAEALLKGGALIPDGAGIVKAVKWLRSEKIERIAGWDLFVHEMDFLEQRTKNKEQRQLETACLVSYNLETRHVLETRHALSAAHKKNVFFLGSSEAVLAKIKDRAAVDYPHLKIHTYSPPYKPEFSEEDNQKMIAAINNVQPDLLWIGMTAPKQEKWAYRHFEQMDVKGHIGTIGAVFDFYAGTVKRAPVWWQEHSLEWLYRLIKEPRRMWRRYLIGNVQFIGYILQEKLRG